MKFLKSILFSAVRFSYFRKKEGAILITNAQTAREALRALKKKPNLNVQVKTVIIISRLKQTLKKNFPKLLIKTDVEELPLILKADNISLIIVYLPQPDTQLLHYIVDICKNRNVYLKELAVKAKKIPTDLNESNILPTQIKKHDDKFYQLRNIHPEKLLYQKPISLDDFSMKSMIEKKVILITGAGGSIGSELSRQISKYKPSLLIFFDITELFLYSLEIEFRTEYPNVNFVSILGDVQDDQKTEGIIKTYRPNVIFHAAAYKHVPMLEENPMAAIENNIKSTWQLANFALKYKVDRFVFISTDKAVNPINIMGASKRVCELICQYLQNEVRYG